MATIHKSTRPGRPYHFSFLVISLLSANHPGGITLVEGINNIPSQTDETWQQCDVFMAPTNTSAGWGVFAARDFEHQELLDIPPFFLAFEEDDTGAFSHDTRLIKSSALDDYVYRVHRRGHRDAHQMLVLYGYEAMFNHHPDANVQLGMSTGYAQGFYSKRKIRAGEQLFSSYGQSDGGQHWFESRGLPMQSERSNIDSRDKLDFLKTLYCTKIYAGPGPSNFQQLIPPVDQSRIAPFEAGVFDARAKVPIKAGDQIEQGPAMLLYKPFVDETALGPLVIAWDDLFPIHQDALRSASKPWGEKLPVQYQGEASQWERIRRLASIDKIALLPFAGRMGLVRRVHNNRNDAGGEEEEVQEPRRTQGQSSSSTTATASGDTSNCRLEIDVVVQAKDGDDDVPYVSVVLTLVATADIKVGELLKMDLKPAGTAHEKELLKSKLRETGHLHALIDS